MWLCVSSPRGKTPPFVTVTGYSVIDASHDTASDGSVTVLTNAATGDRVCVFWSHGVHDEALTVHNVRPGTYAAIVTDVNGMPVRCMHSCPPARVGVRGSGVAQVLTTR